MKSANITDIPGTTVKIQRIKNKTNNDVLEQELIMSNGDKVMENGIVSTLENETNINLTNKEITITFLRSNQIDPIDFTGPRLDPLSSNPNPNINHVFSPTVQISTEVEGVSGEVHCGTVQVDLENSSNVVSISFLPYNVNYDPYPNDEQNLIVNTLKVGDIVQHKGVMIQL